MYRVMKEDKYLEEAERLYAELEREGTDMVWRWMNRNMSGEAI